jgi:hypothetical protein
MDMFPGSKNQDDEIPDGVDTKPATKQTRIGPMNV